MKILSRDMLLLILVPYLLSGGSLEVVADTNYEQQRKQLVSEIERTVTLTAQYIGKKSFDKKVMNAMGNVPRHKFVPQAQVPFAYINRPLPIGYGQTISQPYIVALMTDLLNTKPGDHVLEIGTGSGYQAAILAELTRKVYTIEIIEPLAKRAASTFQQLGISNIKVKTGDGYYGWKAYAPYDAIVVTAAASHIPPPLVKQLKPGGRMIIPVGSRFLVQQLLMVEKNDAGKVVTHQVLPVRFVPLTGGH